MAASFATNAMRKAHGHCRTTSKGNHPHPCRITRGIEMKAIKTADGLLRIKIEDTDSYEVTDDNGVNFWPTKKQLDSICRKHLQEHP
jgi:hypothetical protein